VAWLESKTRSMSELDGSVYFDGAKIRRSLHSLQVWIAQSAMVIQSDRDKLGVVLQQKLNRLFTLLCRQDGRAQVFSAVLLVIDGFQLHIRRDACLERPPSHDTLSRPLSLSTEKPSEVAKLVPLELC
jgi:hypothetical protein